MPAGPPLSARVTRALTRWARLGRRVIGHRSVRLALGVMLSTVVTSLVLAAPMLGGAGAVRDADGLRVSSAAFAGLTSTATFSSATGKSAAAPSSRRSTAGHTASSAPSATTSAPIDAPAPVTPVPVAPPEPPVEAAAAPEGPAAAPVAPAPAVPVGPAAPVAPPAPVAPAAPVATAAAAPAAGSAAEQVLALVNAERAAAGCRALSADGSLAAVALAHSEDMRDRDFFDHVDPDGRDPFDRAERAGTSARAENIAQGQQDPADVMRTWMDSSGHRKNILNCDLTRLGVGVASGSSGAWWTQLFA